MSTLTAMASQSSPPSSPSPPVEEAPSPPGSKMAGFVERLLQMQASNAEEDDDRDDHSSDGSLDSALDAADGAQSSSITLADLLKRLNLFDDSLLNSGPPAPQRDDVFGPDCTPPTFEDFCDRLGGGEYGKILVVTGAGVSVSAGIPDFRTPGTGLYDNLEKYNLPHPSSVFDLDFYRSNPSPFVTLASEIWPGKHRPTLTHAFIKLLADRGILLRNYTQNIDGLEVLAGVPPSSVIECHGHFRRASCTKCGKRMDIARVKREVIDEKSKCCAAGRWW